MTDIRRTLLWVVFSMSLVLLWDAWSRHTGAPGLFNFGPRATATAPAAGPQLGAGSVPASLPGQVPVAAGQVAGTAPAPVAGEPAAPSQKFQITTDVMTLTLDSRGGDVDRVELLKYKDPLTPDHRVVLMDDVPPLVYKAQTGFLSPTAGQTLPTHFTAMTLLPGERALGAGQDAFSVQLESAEVGGAKAIKTYTFHRGQYTIDVKNELVNVGSKPIEAQLYLQLLRDGNPPPGQSSFYHTFTGPAIYNDAHKFQKIEFKTIDKQAAGEKPSYEIRTDDGWVAMVQHYFASAWLLPDGVAREFRTSKAGPDLYTVAMVTPLGTIAPGATKTQTARLFVGPQEEKKLAALAPGLELVKDYGWFTVLSKPLFWLLDELDKLLGNWGWAIVALVVLLKAAFYYLNASAYKSMAKMKAINPKVMEMRERYKDKPQQMQQEMMRIYREEKVNPIGSCLPIFLQMPFFIALYWVLLSSVEMRGAPWIGWIGDLSARDPFFILPVLMTLSSLLQVWLNPTPPDPMQAKLMWIMPLAFSVMFFFFPAGLVLYWLTNNLLSIAQQWFINKRLGLN